MTPKLLTAAALSATIAASLPGAARACDPTLAARILSGSAIGGVPCLPSGPVAMPAARVSSPAVRVPSGGGFNAGAAMGAVGLFGAVLDALQSNDRPAASTNADPSAEEQEARVQREQNKRCPTMSPQECADFLKRAANITQSWCNGTDTALCPTGSGVRTRVGPPKPISMLTTNTRNK
jgi:hypothetical protein